MASFTHRFGEYSAKMRRGHSTMQLDVNELQSEDQEEERSLPVDERLANAAPDPVIDAEIEQRRERPDGFALGRDVAQQAGSEAGENVHGQRQPFAQKSDGRATRTPPAVPTKRPPMTPIRIAPSKAMSAAWKLCTEWRASTPNAMGVPTMKTISSFSLKVRSSRNSSTRKRRARTSTLLIAAATPRRISKVTRMRRWSKVRCQLSVRGSVVD